LHRQKATGVVTGLEAGFEQMNATGRRANSKDQKSKSKPYSMALFKERRHGLKEKHQTMKTSFLRYKNALYGWE